MTPDALASRASDLVEQMQDQPAHVAHQLLDALHREVEEALRDLESMEIGN